MEVNKKLKRAQKILAKNLISNNAFKIIPCAIIDCSYLYLEEIMHVHLDPSSSTVSDTKCSRSQITQEFGWSGAGHPASSLPLPECIIIVFQSLLNINHRKAVRPFWLAQLNWIDHTGLGRKPAAALIELALAMISSYVTKTHREGPTTPLHLARTKTED